MSESFVGLWVYVFQGLEKFDCTRRFPPFCVFWDLSVLIFSPGLTIDCGGWGLSCCLLSRAGANRIRVPNFRMVAEHCHGESRKQ